MQSLNKMRCLFVECWRYWIGVNLSCIHYYLTWRSRWILPCIFKQLYIVSQYWSYDAGLVYSSWVYSSIFFLSVVLLLLYSSAHMRISDNCSSMYAFGDTVFLFSSLTQFLLLIALGRRSVEFLRWIKFLICSSLKFLFVKYMDELCPVLSYTTVPKKIGSRSFCYLGHIWYMLEKEFCECQF